MPDEKEPLPPEIEEGKTFAAVGYLGVFFLLPLLARKNNSFCQHHGKQGMVLFVAELVGVVVILIANAILGMVPCAGWLIALLLWIAFIGTSAWLSILGIIKALQGEYWKIPVLSGFAEKLKF